MRCSKTKTNGKQCNGHAMLNGEFCYLHSPDIPETQKQKNRAMGGKNNALAIAKPLPPLKIEGATDVIGLLVETVNEVRAGRLETRLANSLAILSGHLLRAFEISDLEKRLEKLEIQLEEKIANR